MTPLQPKDVQIECHDGTSKAFTLSKFPAIAGREIITQYPLSALPKVGDYATNKAMMLKIMAFVSVPTDAGPLALSTESLVDNHVPDFECLMRLEMAMIEYNVSFFANGKASTFFGLIAEKAQALITKTSTDLQGQFSPKNSPPTKN